MMKFIARNIQYTDYMRGEHGRVMVKFTVEKDGRLNNFEIIRGINSIFDAEAIRVCKSMPTWEPAEHNGEKIPYNMTIPVVFRLQ